MGDGGDAHVKIRGERVEDLVGANMGVGVNDTLATALHGVGCEVDDGGAGECEGQVRTGALVQCWLNWTWGEILEAARLRRATERLCPSALPRAASASRLLGRGAATGDPSSSYGVVSWQLIDSSPQFD